MSTWSCIFLVSASGIPKEIPVSVTHLETYDSPHIKAAAGFGGKSEIITVSHLGKKPLATGTWAMSRIMSDLKGMEPAEVAELVAEHLLCTDDALRQTFAEGVVWAAQKIREGDMEDDKVADLR